MYEVELEEHEGHTIWFALEKYQEVLKKDLETKYDGDPKFCDEDEVFLTGEIRMAERVLSVLQEHGLQPFEGVHRAE